MIPIGKVLGVALLAAIMAPVGSRAQSSCDDYDPCTVSDACQIDGSCHGTPKPPGSACIPLFSYGCATSGMCREVVPGFTVCVAVETAPAGTACTIPDVDPDALGGCGRTVCREGGICGLEAVKPAGTPCSLPGLDDSFLGGCGAFTCQQTGLCSASATVADGMPCPHPPADYGACAAGSTCKTGICLPKQCPDSADKCAPSYCDDQTGECEMVALPCDGLCATCDPATGACSGAPKPDGAACYGDGVCVEEGRCVDGICTADGSSPTPTPNGACGGDCDGNHVVSVDELVKLVNIALGSAPLASCASGDADQDGQITINELIAGVASALNGC